MTILLMLALATRRTAASCQEGFIFINSSFSHIYQNPIIRVSLGCVEVIQGHVKMHYVVEKVGPGFSHARTSFERFFGTVALRVNANGTFFFMAGDQSTLPESVEIALYERKSPFLSHGHYQYANPVFVIFIPDPTFIDTNGFRTLLGSLTLITNNTNTRTRHPLIFWRGSTTGIGKCEELPRVRLCKASKVHSWLDVKISRPVQSCTDELSISYIKDILATGHDETHWVKNRGLIDIDGNVNAWGLFWRLASGSVIFKVESRHWNAYSSLMQPWKHFIPILSDLSDLEEKTKIIVSEDPFVQNMMQQITKNAKELASKFDYNSEVSRVARELQRVWTS